MADTVARFGGRRYAVDNAASQYGQAALEIAVFRQLSRIGRSPWRTGDPMFGVTWLTPHHGEPVMRIADPSCRM
ncbi:hypothetical protein AB0J63_11675 [Streptosporangium canum]|uniref:hypothetical protein n=1 Tax=Streptosporangium canum TaxID=324952 RepID=UPI00342359EE